MSLKALPAEWQAWVIECVKRKCSDETMLPHLIKNGTPLSIATQAVFEARHPNTPSHNPLPPIPVTKVVALRPSVDTTHNFITCPDGQVVQLLAYFKPLSLVLFENMLTEEECDTMVAMADARLKPSKVVDTELGTEVLHEHRSSTGCCFTRGETPLLKNIEERIAFLVNWPADRGEGVQVLRYENGGEYRPHFDYFDPANSGSHKHLQHGGQRVGTVVLYLSDVEAGGSTSLPTIGFEARPRKGSALFFCDVDEKGVVEPLSLHAGDPVTKGVKYIATKWMRERYY